MTLSVFADHTIPASDIVHGVVLLKFGLRHALLCDVRENTYKTYVLNRLLVHVRVIGRRRPGTFVLPVEETRDPVDCMACLTAEAVFL